MNRILAIATTLPTTPNSYLSLSNITLYTTTMIIQFTITTVTTLYITTPRSSFINPTRITGHI